MVYETSYESGRKPFVPDLTRGQWAAPSDFIYICIGFALKLEVFTNSWYYFAEIGVVAAIPYVICLALYVVPLMVMLSFMGQFSSSGFLSAFRVSPLFKGMGYISLASNLCVLSFYSVFAVVPILFFINSFQRMLPWSCDAQRPWEVGMIEEYQEISVCNKSLPEEATEGNRSEYDMERSVIYNLPGRKYFKSFFPNGSMEYPNPGPFALPWELASCNLLCWTVIAFIFYKFTTADKLGKLLRYCVWITFGLMCICLARFLFLPGASTAIHDFFIPRWEELGYGLPCVPMFAMASLGPGWGVIVSLASFNKFKANIMTYSWIIAFGQLIIFLMFGLLNLIVERVVFESLPDAKNEQTYSYVDHVWALYFSTATVLATLEWANLWTIIYYGMLTMAAMVVLITQVQSVLVSVFDEFEYLRTRKFEVTFGLMGFLCLISMYFCTNEGVLFFSVLSMDTSFNQITLCLLLLLVILWVYGRERFQRDIQFMLGQPFSTWKVNMLRYVSPICLIFIFLVSLGTSIYEHIFATDTVVILSIFLILLPWICIPGYAIFYMLQTSGSFCARFKRCGRPTDWYPVDCEDRQRYEEAMGNMDITHQLDEVTEEAD